MILLSCPILHFQAISDLLINTFFRIISDIKMEKIQNTLSQLLSSNLVKIPLATIGAGCVLGKCYSALNGAYRHFLRSPIDLQRRYGK